MLFRISSISGSSWLDVFITHVLNKPNLIVYNAHNYCGDKQRYKKGSKMLVLVNENEDERIIFVP